MTGIWLPDASLALGIARNVCLGQGQAESDTSLASDALLDCKQPRRSRIASEVRTPAALAVDTERLDGGDPIYPANVADRSSRPADVQRKQSAGRATW